MTYIVHGATGAQGSPVATALRASGHAIVAASRGRAPRDGHPAVAVDYSSISSLEAAYAGVDGVFVHLPIGSVDQQRTYAQTIGEAVARAKPARVVFSTSGYASDASAGGDGPAATLVRSLESSGVSFAVVEPRLFLENLLLPVTFDVTREKGLLRYPIRDDYAISWCSHLDVADLVVALLTDRTTTGTVSVGAVPGLLGADLAAGFAEYLGREVAFEAISPQDYGDLIVPMFGEAGARPVVEGYEWRSTQPDEVIPELNSAQQRMGLKTRGVTEWLRSVIG